MIPAELRDVLFDFWWDETKLHALDLPVFAAPTRQWHWLFDLPLWQVAGIPFRVTPNQVRANPMRYAEQYARTMAADIRHPIHVAHRGDRIMVMDGIHRLLKAELYGAETVLAKYVPASAFPAIGRDSSRT